MTTDIQGPGEPPAPPAPPAGPPDGAPVVTVAEFYEVKGLEGPQVRSLPVRLSADGRTAWPVAQGRPPLARGAGVPGCFHPLD